MALTVDEIAEILNTMRVENEHNVENFEKVLTGINSKLEIMADDNETVDLVKLYISELKKSVDDKHINTLQKLDNFENSLKNISSFQNELVKTSEFSALLKILNDEFRTFSRDTENQNNLINELSGKIEKIGSDIYNKDELAYILNGFSADLSGLMADNDKSFKKIEALLEQAAQNIKNADTSEQVNSLKLQIDTLSSDINSIPSKISFDNLENRIAYFQGILNSLKDFVADNSAQSTGIISDKFSRLEEAFKNIVTDSDFSGFKADLADFVQKIIDNSSALNSELSYSTERIENILATVNALDYAKDFDIINSKLEELQSVAAEIINKNFDGFSAVEKRFADIVSEEDFNRFKNDLTEYINRILDNALVINNDLKYNREQADNILKAINLLDYKNDFDALTQKINELRDILKSVSQANDYEFQNLSGTLASIVTDSDFAGFKADLADFVQKIIDNSSALNKDLEYSTERIENILTSINSLDYKENFDDITSKFSELKSEVNGNLSALNLLRSIVTETSDSVLDRISRLENTLSSAAKEEDLSSIKQSLTELIEKIHDDTVSVNSELSYSTQRIENIYDAINVLSFKDDFDGVNDKINELKDIINLISSDNLSEFEKLQKNLSTIVTDADFAGFKADLADFVQKIIDNSSALNSELSYSTERIENILTTVKALDFRDDFENIVVRINDIKETFEDNSKQNYTNLSMEISDLSARFDTTFSNLDSKNQEIYGNLKFELSTVLENLKNIIDANPQKAIDELTGLTGKISSDILSLRNGIVHDIQDDYGDLKLNISAIISNLQIVKDDIISKNNELFNSSTNNFSNIENRIDEQIKELDGLKTSILESDKLEPAQMTGMLDKLYIDLSDLINDIKENSNSNYEAVKEYLAELTANVNSIQSEFNMVSEKISLNIISKVDVVSSSVDTLRNEFVQYVSSNLENSSKILDGITGISNDVTSLREVFDGNAKENFALLKARLEELSDKLRYDIAQQKDLFLQAGEESDKEKLEFLKNVSDDIKNLEALFLSNSEAFKHSVRENILEIKEYISEANNSLYASQSDSENKLTAKLEALEVLNQAFEASIANVNSGIKNILEIIASLDVSEQNDIIQNRLINIQSSSEMLLSAINNVNGQNDELSKAVSSLSGIISTKDDMDGLSERVNQASLIIASLKDLISESFEANTSLINILNEKFETSLASVVSENDFINFKSELGEFLQTITDNSNIVNTNFDVIRERIAEISDNISKLEPSDYSYDLTQISSKIDDLSELFENSSGNNFVELSQKIDDAKNEILEAAKSEKFINKLDEFSNVLSAVKDIISGSVENNSEIIDKQFVKFEEAFSKVVSEEDFANFRYDFADFIQKILDNSEILHVNSEANKEQIAQLAKNLECLDNSADFQELKEKIDEIKTSFERTSKTNYDNIINEINSIKEDLKIDISSIDNSAGDKYDVIRTELSDLAVNVQFLRDFSSQKSSEILEKISYELTSASGEICRRLNEGTKPAFDDLSALIANILSEINGIKDDFTLKSDANTYNISSGFENIKVSMENLVSSFTSFQDLLNDGAVRNSDSIISSLNEMALKVEELVEDVKVVSSGYSKNVLDAVSELSLKIDALSDDFTNSTAENLTAFKDSFNSLYDNLQVMHGEYSQELKDIGEVQIVELKNISGNMGNFKAHVDELIDNLKEYITELNIASKSSKSLSDAKFAEKLLDLEAAMVNSSDIYEQKMEMLQSKLSEFAQIIEGSSSDTEAKIASSIDEISELKNEIASISNLLKSTSEASDEKLTQNLSLIDSGIDNVIASVNEINSNIANGFDERFKESLSLLEDRLDGIIELVNQNTSDDIGSILEDKFSGLKQELELINTDINSALQAKKDDIVAALDQLQTGFDEFSRFDFADILSELKSQLELSFMNFSVDVNGELASNSETLGRMEQTFKEVFNSISIIEECVSDKIQNNLELLNITVDSCSRDVKNYFGEKLEEYISDLKSQLETALNNTKTVERIDNLKDELSIKLDSVLNEQNSIAGTVQNIDGLSNTINQKLDVLVESSDSEEILNSLNEIELKAEQRGVNLTEILNALNSKIDIIADDASLKFALTEITEKLEAIEDNNTLDAAVKILSEKIDVIASDPSIEMQNELLNNAFQEINSKIDVLLADNSFDEFKNNINNAFDVLNSKIDTIAADGSLDELNSGINEAFEGLNSKIDILAADSSIDELHNDITASFEELNSKLDVIASDSSVEELSGKVDEISETEDKVAEMLSALHEKVDVLAMDGSDFDIGEEIEDIKDLIFEQRKYFEATSDEKASAIDKYLRDVLLKLDNVDLEKNTEDIKESIMNALVSLFDQISFVEETEDIKDFVEEKTDEINQNLIEVQNQLKQIASSNDDYEYSYTLQDVETDIAKLRLAINNMSGSDFGSLSDDIKRIVNSVEELESSLTQDQMLDLKGDIEKLNEDILSISSRTNKLLLTSDESYKALNDGLNNFSNLVYRLEDRINYLDNSEVSERLERKVDNILSMSVVSANADKVFHQVMMYLGEWIDSTTENISSITEKTSEIAHIKKSIEELKETIPEKSSILDELENKFEQQELRIDRLEMKLEKILSALEEKDDMMLNRKVDKIEKLISRLGTNIEKLTSYVDEE